MGHMRELIYLFKLVVILVVFILSASQEVSADCRGCCSYHGGVVCENDITQCADGTPLSITCVNKGCNLCSTTSCDSTHLDLCATQTSCQSAGGNWCGEVCQSGQCPSCDPSDLSLCSSEIICVDAGGKWCSNACSERISQDYSTTFPSPTDEIINIASFNIQVFGPTKASKPEVMQKLAEIVSEYDIVAIQEIRDATGTAIEVLESAVDSLGTDYEYIIGPRLGRTTSKEQYAYMYRKNTITVVDSYTFDEKGNDVFHREPFIARFQAKSGKFVFVLITIHVDPNDATNEISNLDNVVAGAEEHYPNETDFMILGDLNSDCSYFNETIIEQYFPESYYSIITGNNFDTNLSCSECTYDRIIVTNEVMTKFSGAKGTFEFDRYYSLPSDQADDISDHYPVWASFANAEEVQCGSDPVDPTSGCVKAFPWLMLLLD